MSVHCGTVFVFAFNTKVNEWKSGDAQEDDVDDDDDGNTEKNFLIMSAIR